LSTLIESPSFPINEINQFSADEKKDCGRWVFWKMVFWWTRKPSIGAKAVIAGALLLINFGSFEFKHLIRLLPATKSPHRKNPCANPRLHYARQYSDNFYQERIAKNKLLGCWK
jgi:putative DNA methylase